MGGKFVFELRNPELLNKPKYLQAIRELKKLIKPPPEVYASWGPEDMGMALVVKIQHKTDWNLVLPTDPSKSALECGFTYGITSRSKIWEFVKTVLCHICLSCPGAFEFNYEDADLGEFKEIGYLDYNTGKFVVQHVGLPSAADFEKRSSITRPAGAPGPGPSIGTISSPLPTGGKRW